MLSFTHLSYLTFSGRYGMFKDSGWAQGQNT